MNDFILYSPKFNVLYSISAEAMRIKFARKYLLADGWIVLGQL